MFFHLYRYRILSLLRAKQVLFWCMIFPILLGTLFYVAFGSQIGTMTSFETVPIAIVGDSSVHEYDSFVSVAKTVEESEGHYLFDVTECSEAEAIALLDEDKVLGIIRVGDDFEIEVKGSGLSQSIIKQFTDTFRRTIALYTDVAKIDVTKYEEIANIVNSDADFLKSVSLGGESIDGEIQYFYALLSMACLYGSFVGITIGSDIQANDNPQGARKAMSSVNRFKVIIADMLAALTINFIEIMIVWAYLRFALGLPIGNNLPLFSLVCLLGSMIGITIGQTTACLARGKEGLKIGISLGFSMVSCFLGGLMVGDMKNVIESSAPIINRINPSALITDAFYCLTVYSDYKRFTISLVTLAAEAIILTTISFFAVRRVKHASI